MSSIDPYLFYVHELRKYSPIEPLRFIVVVGYSFSDDYVNGLIRQAVTLNEYLKVLVVAPIEEKQGFASDDIEGARSRVAKILKVDKNCIAYENLTTKNFFEENMKLTYFSELSGAGSDDPF